MIELLITYSTALGVFIVSWIVLWGAKKLIISRLKKLSEKTSTDLDDALVSILDTINPVVLGAASLAFAIRFAPAPSIAVTVVSAAFLIALVYQISVGVARIVDIAVMKSQGKKGNVDRKAAMSLLSGTVKVIIWAIGGLLVLSNLGVNVTSLIAGLGIGGVAIAFALQNILADLFSSFAIYFDKPFEVGDLIVVGEHTGTVEKIGIKTTRLRALQGEEIVIANAELTSARIQNFRKLKERRISFSFGVLYETPIEKVEKIQSIVQKIVEGVDAVRFDRVFFTTLAASSLDFEVVYFVLSDEYKQALAAQQEINLQLMKAFEKEGIEFAYPTQTLYVKK